MPTTKQPPGCRDAAIATGFLLAFGIVLFAIGLTLINQESCSDICETAGLMALYAGGPISALFGVFTEWIVSAWPLDITLWVVLGFTVARFAENRGKSPLGMAFLTVLLALAYGLVLSLLVELTV